MTNNPRTSKGRAISDDEIDSLAREAEAGYDVAALKRSGGRKPMGSAPARVVPVRLDPELDAALRARADADHANASEIIRAAIRAYLRSA